MKRSTRLASALLATATVFAATNAAAASDVVISQVYGGAGCTTAACATYDRDYIELFNKGANPVTLNGYSVQYHSKSATGNWAASALPNVTIPAGGYYLIAESASAPGNFANTLPTPDLDVTASPIAMSATDGVVALVNSTTALTCLSVADCSTASNSAVADLVGFGTAVIYRGSAAAAAPSKTTADLRAASGCTNTDNNGADFTADTPAPRNSATPVHSCGGGSTPTNPSASGSANPASVAQGGNTMLTVLVTPGTLPASVSYTVTVDLTSIGGANGVAMTDGGPDGSGHEIFTSPATVTPATTAGSKSLPVSVTDDQNRTASTSIALAVTVPPITIMAIQGHGAKSTKVGQTVTTTGIVTALNNATNPPKGFFIQDPNGDNDPTTSDGIYVYKGSAPGVAVGDLVTVTGKVSEYNGTTELGSPLTIVPPTSHGNALPAAFDLGAHPPTDDYNTGVCMGTGSTIQPMTDGFQASNFACLDGMLVSFNGATIVAATGGGGGGGNAPDNPQYFYASLDTTRQFRTPGIVPGDPGWANLGLTMANFDVPVYSGNPNIFEVYYGLGLDVANLPDVGQGHGVYNVGHTVGVASGIVQGFQFTDSNNNFAPTSPVFYEIYPLGAAGVTVSGTALTLPVPVAASEPGTLTIGTQNGLHFFNAMNDGNDSSAYVDACLATEAGVNISGNVGTLATPLEPGDNDTCPLQQQYDTRLSKMSLQIRNVLLAPVVQVLQEIENIYVLGDIKDKIHTDDSSLTYHPFLFNGNDPQGINIGILVKDGVTVNSVSQLALNTMANACSGGGSCLLNDRPPVLLDANYNGYPFRVLAIYDRSLGSLSEKAYVGQKRRAQAEQVAKIVQVLQSDGGTLGTSEACSQQVDGNGTSTSCSIAITGSSAIPLVVIGDFNANEFTDGYVDVVGTIMGTVDTDPTHSIYPPTASYVAPNVPNPTLVNAVEATLDPATHPLDWNPNYSYSFDGISEEIDHILVTQRGWKDFVRISHAKGNSDVSSASPDINDANTPRRLSDHDGQVITFAIDRIFANGFDGAQ